jgi:hypothetical protein
MSNVLHLNNLLYFPVPKDVFTIGRGPEIKGSPLSLYIYICFLSQEKTKAAIHITNEELLRVLGMVKGSGGSGLGSSASVTPTLTFATIPAQTYGASPIAVSATSSSNGVVTYAVTSGPATISGNAVSVTGVGTVVLSANQAASGNYTSATASTSFAVSPGNPNLTFTPIPMETYGSGPLPISITSSSSGAVTMRSLAARQQLLGR